MTSLAASVILLAGLGQIASEPEFALGPAEEPPVATGFHLAEQLTAVTRGRVQIETGYAYTHDTFAGLSLDEHTLPDLLVRIGLTQRLELRIGWPGVVIDQGTAVPDGPETRTLDPNVGFLLDLVPQCGLRPQCAVLASAPITLEGDPFSAESLQPLAEALYAWYPAERWCIGGSTGMALFHESGDHFTQFQQSLGVDWLATDRLGTFVSWSMLADAGSADDGTEHLLSLGFGFAWTDWLQTNWRAGMGLNERAPDFLTGVRMAVHF